MSDKERIAECLEHLKANPPKTISEIAWERDVLKEARELGILPPIKPAIGCNCRPDIDAKVVYGGDMESAF